jgi:hypothetical protein
MIKIDFKKLNSDLIKYRKKLNEAVREVIADYTYDFVYTLANATPVGNTAPYPEGWLHLYQIRNKYQGLKIQEGYAMGNWRITFRPSETAVSRYETNPSLIATTAFERIADEYTFGQPIYIVNNAPYIKKLDDGQSSQAEAGYIDAIVQQYRNFGKYSSRFNALMAGV